ncbi:MAG: NAD-dependent protein deacylase [Clostridia bacterium]
MDNLKLETLKKMIESAKRIAFLGGAGVSTESGIPDFRSENGIFDAIKRFGYPPEVLLSHSFFLSHTEDFYEYYKSALLVTDAIPNAAHIALSKLEKTGKLTAVITQNIDGLHQKAGSECVFELHGSIYRNYCMKCKRAYDAEYIKLSVGVPKCVCGGTIKPNVVLYEEPLESKTIEGAVKNIMRADMLIVGGTSLSVYPAAGLIEYYRGDKLALINKSKTPYDNRANVIINEAIGEVLKMVIA